MLVQLNNLSDVLQKNHTETVVVEEPIELISRWTNFENCGRFGRYDICNNNDFSIKANAGTDKLAQNSRTRPDDVFHRQRPLSRSELSIQFSVSTFLGPLGSNV